MIPPSSPSPAAAATLEPVPLPRTGSLRAVKLTGDPNVPRGEVSFEIPRLSVGRRSTRRSRNGKNARGGRGSSSSKGGLLRIETESPFNGCPVFRGYGHVAEDGFRRCSVLPVQVVLVSVDHVAVWWEDLRKVAYFRRVDLEELWRR
ncbi:hypothetical protein KEM55_006283 [Ascosphaera atra]|nr:hypothetical protein KEM55_006283 [Ascosphaera atra]